MVGLLAGVGLTRLKRYRQPHGIDDASRASQEPQISTVDAVSGRTLLIALSAYIVLVVLAFAINLIEPLNAMLSSVKVTLQFPELSTAYGWVTSAGSGRKISLFDHPGAILLYSSLIAYVIYARSGCYRPGAARRILARVAKGAMNSSLGIAAMVGMATLMSHAEMTDILARGLSQSFGPDTYPVIAAFIGALGAFITGSNNNSNVLFAVLQMRTAELLGLSVTLILAAQTAGGSLGSVVSPAKVIVGCSTVGLGDEEGQVMRSILAYGLIPVVVVAIVMLLLSLLGFSSG
jgi:lactate permease